MNVQLENVMPDGFVYERAQNVMHGTCSGIAFLIVPVMSQNQYRIQLHADVEKSGEKERFLNALGGLQQEYEFVQYAGYNGMNTVSINVVSREQEDKENLTQVVSELAKWCEEFHMNNCCSRCKNVLPLRTALVDGNPELLCGGCFSQVMNGADAKNRKKENLPLGLIGAALGVLLGTVLWVIIGQFGFIAGIAGYAIVFCGMKGYELLGRKLSKAGIVICVLLSLLMIAGAEYISLGLVIYKELKEVSSLYVSLGDAFAFIPELLGESEVAAGVAKDLIVGYGLAIWASFSSVRIRWKQVEQEQKPHVVVPF